MNYLDKYLKYKNKYLELKLQQQIGGEIPINLTIRNIQLIEDKCVKHYLDPIWGYIYCNNGFIFNYFHFYDKDDKDDKLNFIGKIINKIFDRNLILSDTIDNKAITCKVIGNIISYLYLYKFHNLEKKLKIDKPARYKKDKDKDLCKQKLINIIERKIDIISGSKMKEVYNIIKECGLVDAFRTLLIILWYKANDKNGIKEYYEGINEIFTYYNLLVEKNEKMKIIDIPDNFLDIDIKGSNFQEELILVNSDFHIYHQERPLNVCNTKFPDCGEQTVRNFINIICFNGKIFDINILTKLNATCKVIEYYTIFNNFSKQTSGNYKIFGKIFNGRTAWNFIVSDLEDVKYNNIPQKCLYNGKNFLFNIDGGMNLKNNMPNLFQVIINLFEGIKTFDELIKKLKENKIINSVTDYQYVNNKGIGKITFDFKKWIFTMLLSLVHYDVEIDTKLIKENKSLSDEEREIINTLQISSDYKIIINKDFMYKKLTKENIIYILNEIDIDDNLYNKIFRYTYKLNNYYTNRISLKFNKIKNLSKYDLANFGVGYICSDKEKIITSIIIKQNIPLYDTLSAFTNFTNLNNLQKLTLEDKFNQPLGTSLNNLTKLETLTFGSRFNESLSNSLDNLINLQELTLSNSLNKPLGNSLYKLTTLKVLTLDNNFNMELIDSLKNLIILEKLTFGNSFNKPLKNSLDNLINLKILILGNSFNEPLRDSLDKLTELKILILGNSFNEPLRDSLDKLTELKVLTLGNNFNIELGDSLNNLINLETLTFGEKFNNGRNLLNNSLNNLINLKTLIFGNNFNIELVDSLNNLTSLTTLTFGNSFNNKDRPLESSLDELNNLQNLTFGTDFNNGRKPLSRDSFIKLSNLKTLTLSQRFNNMKQPLYLPNLKLNFPNGQNPFLNIIK